MKRNAFLFGAASSVLLATPLRAATLSERLAAIARTLPGTLGVTCRTLGSDPPIFAYNGNEQFPTASTIKVLILATAYVIEEQNPGTLDTEITTHRRNLISGSDFMSRAYDGERFRVRDLLRPMIQLSDNTASNTLIGFFGTDLINTVGAAAGMERTRLARKFLDYTAIVHHQDNLTTPGDMAQLLYQIARGAREGITTICNADHCRSMIELMLGQTDRDGIPAGLPSGTQVANKTGEIDGTRNDVAIVEPFAESPYVLSVYTKDVRDYGAAYGAIHHVARLSYATLAKSQE